MTAVYIAVFLALLSEVETYPAYQKKVPNGVNVPGVEAIGHKGADGGPNNQFGRDFAKARFRWTRKFCMKDSDGDGQTNGQELGDPCCEFVVGKNEKVRWTEGVSHPGNPKRMADAALWEGVVCGEEGSPVRLAAGVQVLHASVILSAAALVVLVVYAVTRRRRSWNLPLFRQQRKAIN
ncbi:hypothetical protein PHMEG_00012540 [Phytophthora megakarya]|uniref:Temptin Cys/Cys disulfide domain-containing protein n=1 Tax=Phytophthora megakarya TaxID=4795 RepID=A0A225WAJ8_9STRA|nr:hypothetical protein PHMEG_00012540 [Phytophthora megakarya]